MRKLLKNHKGVTMIEVLVTVAILAIVVVPCLSAFVMAQRGNVKAKETFETYTAAANLMESWKSERAVPNDFFGETIEEGVLYRAYIEEEDLTVTCLRDKEVGLDYYIITIYAGNWVEGDPQLPSEYLIKGVVAQ